LQLPQLTTNVRQLVCNLQNKLPELLTSQIFFLGPAFPAKPNNLKRHSTADLHGFFAV
jgi:hypothetical protein